MRVVPTSRLVAMGLIMLVLPLVGFVLGTETTTEIAAWQGWSLAAALVLRAVLLLPPVRHRGLLPLVDLPLIGVLLMFTGGRDSPLDPALFLIYSLLAFSLDREPQRRWALRYHLGFLVGFLGMNAVLFVSEWSAKDAQLRFQESVNDETKQEIRTAIASVNLDGAREGFELLLRLIEQDRPSSEVASKHPYFDTDDEPAERWRGGTLREDIEEIDTIVHMQNQEVSGLLERLDTEVEWTFIDQENTRVNEFFKSSSEDAGTLFVRISEGFEDLNLAADIGSRVFDWAPFFVNQVQMPLFAAMDQNRWPQQQLHDFIRREYRDSRVWRWELRQDQLTFLVERMGIAILVMAALSITAALRFRFEDEVRAREAARVASEQAEKENWIALTAGLTHTIGNEILAYDAYAEEALDAAEGAEVPIPEVIQHNLRFIYENNKARLGFIKFLDEFARTRKNVLEGRPVEPKGLQRIELGPFVQRVRAQVGDIESADLPRLSRDPGVVQQREKLLSLPLEVEFEDEDARFLSAGRSGILQFFCYELLKNALRNCSGTVPLRVVASKHDGLLRLRFVNDVAIVTTDPGPDGAPRMRLRQRIGVAPCTEEELQMEVQQILAHCFEPGRGGGTGLGLFLIRYFAREYYRGSVSAGILDWEKKLVSFDLLLPDDLAAARGADG